MPNGYLLLRTHAPQENPGPGSAAALLELDWDSNVVWEHRSPLMHLDFEGLYNGNTLLLQWAVLPRDVASQVQGGYVSEGHPSHMVGYLITEVTPRRKGCLGVEVMGAPQVRRRHYLLHGKSQGVDAPKRSKHHPGGRPDSQL